MPAFENNTGNSLPGVEAGADFTAQQFLGVTLDANEQAVLPAAGAQIVGILQNKPDVGQAATIWGPGATSKVVAGGAFDAGDDLSVDADGKFVEATSGQYIVGKAVTGAAAEEEIGTVFITQPGRVA